jgi:hypothetical protein
MPRIYLWALAFHVAIVRRAENIDDVFDDGVIYPVRPKELLLARPLC